MTEAGPPSAEDGLQALEGLLGFRFRDPGLLREAMIHESYSHEHGVSRSNERLEFLGDSVLGLVVGHHLFVNWPEQREGQLTRMKSMVVSAGFLARRARELDLGAYLILGKGEAASGGRQRPSVLADALEALIGAIFLDQGLDAAARFVLHVLAPHLDDLSLLTKDFKGELQEKTQKRFRALPRYTVVSEVGPPHSKSFAVEVGFGSTTLGAGVGPSKKEAEQAAAREALGQFDTLLSTDDDPKPPER